MGKHRRTSGMKDALSEMFGAPAEPKILTAAEAIVPAEEQIFGPRP